ncbi:MAG: hypothetical protein M1834_002741 [Cirrosporium novae-zelandiae]|nr:MAG: hypothetical protein M1834_002741 [Cirrosporium novae-zelandiae]
MASREYEAETGRFEDEPRYDRDRSASPRPMRQDDGPSERARSASPNGRMDSRGPPADGRPQEERDTANRNPGSNLFVTGIHPRLTEEDVSRLFEKYGEVEKCSIMKDPHTQESRGFGFVKMVTTEQADAAKEGLQGEAIEGRTLSIEKARRGRPRTPTPGKYFGPPKRDDFRGHRGGGRFDRYDDRRPYGRRDDYGYRGGSSRYGGGYGDRDRYYDRRDDYGSRGIDRYASGREDRYGGDRSEGRRGGGYYDRDDSRSSHAGYGGGPAAREPRDPYVRPGYDEARAPAEDRQFFWCNLNTVMSGVSGIYFWHYLRLMPASTSSLHMAMFIAM